MKLLILFLSMAHKSLFSKLLRTTTGLYEVQPGIQIGMLGRKWYMLIHVQLNDWWTTVHWSAWSVPSRFFAHIVYEHEQEKFLFLFNIDKLSILAKPSASHNHESVIPIHKIHVVVFFEKLLLKVNQNCTNKWIKKSK